jgi:predicted aspartyl protease
MRPITAALSIGIFASLGALGAPGAIAGAAPSGAGLLAQARDAAGASAWDRVALLQADGQVRASGLSGPWSRSEDVSRGHWAVRTDFGVFPFAEGQDGQRRWRQDASGMVHALNAPFSRSAAITEAWLVQRGWLRPGAGGARIGDAQSRREDGNAFDVVQALPRGGQAVQLWFDASSHLLARTVRTMPISVLTVRYLDYRDESGLQLPFTIESRDSGSSDVETVRVDHWTLRRAVPSQAFTAPPTPHDTRLQGKTTVPLEIDGMVVLEARLNGRPFHFILDTGGHNIITPEVAKALDLHPVGSGTSGGAGAGELAQQYVRIGTLQVGAATMHDQHFYVLPLQYGTIERGTREPLAGLIGLELFERFAARIDYPAKTLTLRKLAAFHHRSSGVAVPIVFDDDMPLLEGRIDGLPGLFALDTGNSGATVVQAVWARSHGVAERMKRGLETVSYGAGGASTNWASRVDRIEIGDNTLHRQIARYAEDAAGAFSSRTEAANIGTDILSHFVIDIDYGHGVIWFEHRPGVATPPFNRSGLRAIKQELASFDVVLVLPASPAARAGLARGDKIVAVDGIAVERLSGRDLAHKLVQAPGTEVALTVRRGDSQRVATVKLVEMLP